MNTIQPLKINAHPWMAQIQSLHIATVALSLPLPSTNYSEPSSNDRSPTSALSQIKFSLFLGTPEKGLRLWPTKVECYALGFEGAGTLQKLLCPELDGLPILTLPQQNNSLSLGFSVWQEPPMSVELLSSFPVPFPGPSWAAHLTLVPVDSSAYWIYWEWSHKRRTSCCSKEKFSPETFDVEVEHNPREESYWLLCCGCFLWLAGSHNRGRSGSECNRELWIVEWCR